MGKWAEVDMGGFYGLGAKPGLNHNVQHKRQQTVQQAAQGDNMVNTPEELGAWLRLLLTPGVGPENARRLLAAFGEPKAIFAQTETALCQVVSAKQAQALQAIPDGCATLTQDTLDWLQTDTGAGHCVLRHRPDRASDHLADTASAGHGGQPQPHTPRGR